VEPTYPPFDGKEIEIRETGIEPEPARPASLEGIRRISTKEFGIFAAWLPQKNLILEVYY
jgi:hypothetical protein